jgi:signal transduction histidine kinase
MRKLFENNPKRLFWILLGIVLTIIAFLVLDSYFKQIELIKQREHARLEAIAGTLSGMIDARALKKLMAEHPDSADLLTTDADPRYLVIHETLKKARLNHNLSSPIRTLIYEPRRGLFTVLVTDEDEPSWRAPFQKYPKSLLTIYESGGTTEAIIDVSGNWLAAAAPLRTVKGELVGIVLVEAPINELVDVARQTALRNSIVSLVIAGVVVTALFIALRMLLNQFGRLENEKISLDKLRKELLANISHDLRTPLANVHGYLETVIMMDNLSAEKRKEYLQTALLSTEKLSNLIQQLFDLSRLESRDLRPEFNPFYINELVSDVLAASKIRAERRQITLLKTIPSTLPAVQADIALINRVLENLISNAIKYTLPGGTVHVKLTENVNDVLVEIIDSGTGMTPQEIALAFERFKTGEQGRRLGGGLGLAIVKSILEMHKSSFTIHSTKNEGTHFSFTLNKA